MGFDEFGDYIPDVPPDWLTPNDDPYGGTPDPYTPSPEPEEEKEYATYDEWFSAQPAASQSLVQAESEAKIQEEKAKTDKAYAEKLAADKKAKKLKTAKQAQAEQIALISSQMGFAAPGVEPQANYSRNIPEAAEPIPTLTGRLPDEGPKEDQWMGFLTALQEEKKRRSTI
jgi:hypothetical protein